MSDPFQYIGARIVESLAGTRWYDAWVRVLLVDQNVGQRTQRCRRTADGPEADFRLTDPIGVLRQVQALRDSMVSQGLPKWRGIVFRVTSAGDFDIEYVYDDPVS